MATYTTAECELYTASLVAAQAARIALLTGKRVVEVQHADKSVSYYAAGQVPELMSLIRELQGLVDACNGVRRRQRAIHPTPTDY